MNNMSNNTEKKYVVVKNLNIEIELESESNEEISVWKYIFWFGLLSILCIVVFLTAKYVVRRNIEGEKPPVDTSERL